MLKTYHFLTTCRALQAAGADRRLSVSARRHSGPLSVLQLNYQDNYYIQYIILKPLSSRHQVHLEVTPLIPRSSAMMTAAFSPIAIAVL